MLLWMLLSGVEILAAVDAIVEAYKNAQYHKPEIQMDKPKLLSHNFLLLFFYKQVFWSCGRLMGLYEVIRDEQYEIDLVISSKGESGVI